MTMPSPVPENPQAELDATMQRASALVGQIQEAQATLNQLQLRIAFLRGVIAGSGAGPELPVDITAFVAAKEAEAAGGD